MNFVLARALFFLFICVACTSALGQTPPAKTDEDVPQDEVIRVDTNLVGVPVTVMDATGKRVIDIKQSEFHLYEDGVEQKIAFFAPGKEPVTVLLLFDKYVLGKQKPFQQISDYRETADLFIKQMRPGDKIIVAKSGSGVSDAFEITPAGTTQKDRHKPGWNFTSAIHDTVSKAIKKMNALPGRKAIVFFSDGVYRYNQEVTVIIGGPLISHRNVSPPESSSEQSTLREIAESDSPIYVMRYDTMGDVIRYDQYQDSAHRSLLAIWREEYKVGALYLRALADKSGARLYDAGKIPSLEQAFAEIASEISGQYSLGYYPKDLGKDSRVRQITVVIDRPGLVLRARSGYLHEPRKQ